MMQFNTSSPGIAAFNAGIDRNANRRRQDDEAARARITFENQQSTDAALRSGIGAFYADDVNQPAPPGVSAAAQPVATPAPAGPAVGPTTLAPRAPYAAAQAPSGDGFGDAAPLPPAQSGAPAAPAAQPTAVRAAPSVTTRPSGGAYNRIQSALAKAPGSGQTMMSLFSADVTSQRNAQVEQRKLEAEGHKLWVQSLKDGDVGMAKEIGKRYNLNIPDQIYNDRGMMIDARVAANLSKTMGVKDDQAAAFVDGFLKARHSGADQGQAAQAGAKAASEAGGSIVHWAVDQQHNVTGFDKRGTPTNTGVKARDQKWEVYPPNASGAGAGSKQREFAEWRIKTLVAGGMLEAQAQQLVAGGASTRPPSPQQRAQLGRQLMNQKDQFGRPIYKTLNDALKAADQALAGTPPAAAPAASPTPAPGAEAPAAASPSAAAAPTRMRFNTSTGQLEPVTATQ